MKKTKLILMGLALFTTIGAAFAFKANRMAGNLFCTSDQGAACVTIGGVFVTFIQDTQGQSSFCSTNSADCPTVTITKKVTANPR